MIPTIGKEKPRKRIPTLGFTLGELIVVVTILAVLAAIGFVALTGYLQDAKYAAAKANVRSIQTAISSESAVSWNSPRSYVVHDAWAALSWAFSYVEWVPVILTGGAWNQAGTNYSAGNPDYAKLKLNAEKFRMTENSPSGRLLAGIFGTTEEARAAVNPESIVVGAFDWTIVQNGRNRNGTFFQVAGISPASGSVAVSGNYPWSSGTAKGLVKDPYSTGPLWALVESVPASAASTAARIKIVWDDLAGRKWSDGSYAANCMEYMNSPVETKTYAWSTGNGSYWIDPNGWSGADAFITYCDTSTNGGGWTQAFWMDNGAGLVYADAKSAFLSKANLDAPWLFIGNALTQNSTFAEIAMDYVTTTAEQAINPNYYSIVEAGKLNEEPGSPKYVFSFVMDSTGTTYAELWAADIRYYSLGAERSWNRPGDINRICNIDQGTLSPYAHVGMRKTTWTLWWFAHCSTAGWVFAIRWNPVSFRASDFDTTYAAVRLRGWVR